MNFMDETTPVIPTEESAKIVEFPFIVSTEIISENGDEVMVAHYSDGSIKKNIL